MYSNSFYFIIATCLFKCNAQSSGTFNGLQSYITDEHNLYRTDKLAVQAANMERMEWSEDLAQKAKNWARACRFEHMTDNYGQNLYMDTRTNTKINAALINKFMYGWGMRELKQQGRISINRNGQVGAGHYNHYSQIVWSGTNQVGCGYAYCSSMRMVVCNYYPPGNYLGRGWYKKGRACSSCPADKPYCSNGLCTGNGSSRASPEQRDEASSSVMPQSEPESSVENPVRSEPFDSAEKNPIRSEPVDSDAKSPVRSEPVDSDAKNPVHSEPADSEDKSPVHSEPVDSDAKSPVHSEPADSDAKSPVHSEPVDSDAKSPVQSEPKDKLSETEAPCVDEAAKADGVDPYSKDGENAAAGDKTTYENENVASVGSSGANGAFVTAAATTGAALVAALAIGLVLFRKHKTRRMNDMPCTPAEPYLTRSAMNATI